MAVRPENHVTRAVEQYRENASTPDAPWPDIEEDLIIRLESEYPPRCYDHRTESLEDHIKYSGMVELVAILKDIHERQQKPDAEVET